VLFQVLEVLLDVHGLSVEISKHLLELFKDYAESGVLLSDHYLVNLEFLYQVGDQVAESSVV
jgi:hypothetical protein